MEKNIIKIDHSKIHEAATLLTLAFEKGSGISRICHTENHELLRRRLYLIFVASISLYIEVNQPILGLTKDEHLIGIAILEEPGISLPVGSQIKYFSQVVLRINPLITWRLLRNIQILASYQSSDAHHLTFLGIHPQFQRQGYGRILLEKIHSISDNYPEYRGIYLETGNSNNVSFYQHFGYHVNAQIKLGKIETFIMFRPNSFTNK